jgi:hypothetical protein
MGGSSKSDSSSTSTQETTTTNASVTGAAGDVVQGQQVTINQELPDQAVDVFTQLVGLSTNALKLVEGTGKIAIDSITQTSQKAAQPDLSVIEGYQDQVKYAIIGIAVVFIAGSLFKGKK